MKYILGKKNMMTQVYDAEGKVHPATLIEAGPITVTYIRTQDADGYKAVQVGFGSRSEKNISKALKGHLKDKGPFAHIKEFRLADEDTTPSVGDIIAAGVFEKGDTVTVSALSKAKGFQGVVKRHGFAGGPRTHGQKHSEREAGSIGGGGGREGGRVAKGKRMAGRMGGTRVTIQNLTILGVDPENNQILVRGAVPGRRGSLVEIKSV